MGQAEKLRYTGAGPRENDRAVMRDRALRELFRHARLYVTMDDSDYISVIFAKDCEQDAKHTLATLTMSAGLPPREGGYQTLEDHPVLLLPKWAALVDKGCKAEVPLHDYAFLERMHTDGLVDHIHAADDDDAIAQVKRWMAQATQHRCLQ